VEPSGRRRSLDERRAGADGRRGSEGRRGDARRPLQRSLGHDERSRARERWRPRRRNPCRDRGRRNRDGRGRGDAARGREAAPARASARKGEAASSRSRDLADPRFAADGAGGRSSVTGTWRLDTRAGRHEAKRCARRRARAARAVASLRPSAPTAPSRDAFLGGRRFGRRAIRARAPRRAHCRDLSVRLGGLDPTGPVASTGKAAPDRPPALATGLSPLGRLIRRPQAGAAYGTTTKEG
jgi:hypothetical protein